MKNRAEHVRLFSKWISWEPEYTNTQALKSNITFQSECDIILSYILEVFLQGVMQMLPSPGLAEAGVGVDHLSEEDSGLHKSLGQDRRSHGHSSTRPGPSPFQNPCSTKGAMHHPTAEPQHHNWL